MSNNPTNEHREQAREIAQVCDSSQCCAQCCLNPQHEHYRKRGGFTCDCCGRQMELRINGKFCNECATGHSSRDAEIREVLEGLATLRRYVHRRCAYGQAERCWCDVDDLETPHMPACLAAQTLWSKLQPKEASE